MLGENEGKMTEYYENFDILLKDIAYSTHFMGIYPTSSLSVPETLIDEYSNSISQMVD